MKTVKEILNANPELNTFAVLNSFVLDELLSGTLENFNRAKESALKKLSEEKARREEHNNLARLAEIDAAVSALNSFEFEEFNK